MTVGDGSAGADAAGGTPWLDVTVSVAGRGVDRQRVDARSQDPRRLFERHLGIFGDVWHSGVPCLVEIADPDGVVSTLRVSKDPTLLDDPLAVREGPGSRL